MFLFRTYNRVKTNSKKTKYIIEHYDNVYDYRKALDSYKKAPDFIYHDKASYADEFEGSFSFTSRSSSWNYLERKIKSKYSEEKLHRQ